MQNYGGMILTGQLLIRTSKLYENPTSRQLVAKEEKLAKEIMNLILRSTFSHTSKGSLACSKILRHEAEGFTSAKKEGVLRIFMAFKNASPSSGFEPANLRYNGKHANHCTTEGDYI
jgi:hypothetical protein